MTDATIRELALALAREQFLNQWPFYLLLLAITLLAGFGSAYLGAYARRRGESFATKADFEALLAQLKATTAVAEEVKAQISHADWLSRENKTVRRAKLEEMMSAVHEVVDWQQSELNSTVFESGILPGPSPLPKLQRLNALYFPEVSDLAHEFGQVHRSMLMMAYDRRKEYLAVGQDQAARNAILAQVHAAWSAEYRKQLDVIARFEKRASQIMKDLLDTKAEHQGAEAASTSRSPSPQ